MSRIALLAATLLIAAGCASTGPGQIEPADVLYRKAYDSLDNNNFQLASERLNTILARYPFTPFAVQAHLDSLYVYHQLGQAETVAEEAERFVRENPRHPEIDYAYYMKGLAYYRDTPMFLERWFNVDEASRDMEAAKKSFRYFGELVARFPDSDYSADARQRMIELKNRMARHQIFVAEYYVRRGAWISALQRAKDVVTEYQGTPAEIDALMIMARAYDELDLPDLAETPRRILAANPNKKPVVLDEDF